MSTPLYIAHDGSPNYPQISREIRCERPGVEKFHYFGETKERTKKHGWRIWTSSGRWDCHGSGYLQKVPFTLRRASDVDSLALDELDAKIRELKGMRVALLRRAWTEAVPVHLSEAVNYESEKIKQSSDQ